MKKSRKEFIKKAHSHACSEWKENIEEEFPKLFKNKLEVGKWYKGGDYLIYAKSLKNRTSKVYGFKNKKWYVSNGFLLMGGYYDMTPASDKEVEEALIKEAKKRGFKKGVVIEKLLETNYGSINIKNKRELESDNLELGNGLLFCNNLLIFAYGKWATIIKTITKEQAEKELGKTIVD